jgi:hypothetical protein
MHLGRYGRSVSCWSVRRDRLDHGEDAMMPNGTRAKRFGQVLLRGMMLVVAVAISGCGARSSDPYAASWDQYIQVMDDALTRGDVNAAEMARQEAFLAARGSRRWDAMVAVGDASVRLMRAPGASSTLRLEARRIYRWALFRARQQGSFEGVVRVSEAFIELGDREAARDGLAMATDMLNGAHDDADRVKSLSDRLDDQASNPGESTGDIGTPAAAALTWTR